MALILICSSFLSVMLRVVLNKLHVLGTFLNLGVQRTLWQVVDSLPLVLI